MSKQSRKLTDQFMAALPKDDRAQRKKMFGRHYCFVNGKMFTGEHDGRLIVRLGAAQRKRLLSVEGAAIFEPMKGKPLIEYVALPTTIVENRRRLRAWLRRSFEYGLSLPPK